MSRDDEGKMGADEGHTVRQLTADDIADLQAFLRGGTSDPTLPTRFAIVDSYEGLGHEEAKKAALLVAPTPEIHTHHEDVRRAVAFEEGPHLDDPILRMAKRVQWEAAGLSEDSPGITEDMKTILGEKLPKLSDDQIDQVRAVLGGGA